MAARGCRAYFFDLFRMRGAARQSAATSKTLFLVNCGSAAVQLQKKQSQRLRLDPYVSHRECSIVVLPAANLRGPPDKYGLVTVRRPSVRCTPRSGSGVLCSAARFVSAKKATMAARGSRAYFFGFVQNARCSEAIRSHVDYWISGELQLCCCTATKNLESEIAT